MLQVNNDIEPPPQSSQGDQLQEEVEAAFQKLLNLGCCTKRCITKVDLSELTDHIVELRAQGATHREAIIMGVLSARRLLLHVLKF